ncbi:MAG: pyridine nucleotide-disulfide oxidoreductase [Sulfuricurvum sp. PC08-66]|nr:MAG: pyridine nucleotide-disulfide oxidoreductase [Sulfuricurvum sp. PC08-66]
MNTPFDLAIIGAGPAGIATAVEAYALGIENIILFEKGENHNMTIRKYYKDNKRVDKDWQGQKVEIEGRIAFVDGTKESTIDLFDTLLANHTFTLQTQTEIFKVVRHEAGFEIFTSHGTSHLAKAVVITIGRMGKPNKPTYALPAKAKERINFTLEFCSLDETILVVGGGDSAIEYAVELSHKNHITLNYRRNAFNRLNPTNARDIEAYFDRGAITPRLGVDIERVEYEEGKLEVFFTDGQTSLYDRIIYAIGGTTPSGFLDSCGVLIEKGVPLYDENYQTNIPNIFVAGDITQERGGSIALGLNHGKRIANYLIENHRL